MPVAISVAPERGGSVSSKHLNKLFLIPGGSEVLNSPLYSDIDKAVNEMFSNYINWISSQEIRDDFKYNFAHNLGSFDGMFLHNALINIAPDNTTCIP